jgi:hypothetical protein
MPVLHISQLATLGKSCLLDNVLVPLSDLNPLPQAFSVGVSRQLCLVEAQPATSPQNLGGFFTLDLLNILRFRPTRLAVVFLFLAIAAFAQDPFSSLGTAATTISTGSFVTGIIELAIVVGGMLMAFSGRVLGGVLIAIIGGGMLALSATKWMGWIQGL